MPTYDYRCDANGRVLEVHHAMREVVTNWGELCERAGVAPGDTPADAPVTRLATGGNVIGAGALSNPEPACSTGACCPSGVCGLDA